MSNLNYIFCIDPANDLADDVCIPMPTSVKDTEDYELQSHDNKSAIIKTKIPINLTNESNKYCLTATYDDYMFYRIFKDNSNTNMPHSYRRCIEYKYFIKFIEITNEKSQNLVTILSSDTFKITFNEINKNNVEQDMLKHKCVKHRYNIDSYDFNNIIVSLDQPCSCEQWKHNCADLVVRVYVLGNTIEEGKFIRISRQEYLQYIENNTCDIVNDCDQNTIAIFPSTNKIIEEKTNYIFYKVTCNNCYNCKSCKYCNNCCNCKYCSYCDNCSDCYKLYKHKDCVNCINLCN